MRLSQKKAFTLAIVLGSFALVGGTGLTVSSAWLITMASMHPPVLVLSVAIVMVRFFGIFRSIARYGERVISHEAIFRKLTDIRTQLFSNIARKLRGRAGNIAAESKTLIDDVERAQEFYLRVTLPGITALVAGLVTLTIAAWIDPVLLIWMSPVVAVFALLIPLLVRRFLDPITERIEDEENLFAAEVSAASFAIVEAEVFGYADSFRSHLIYRTKSLRRAEEENFIRTSALQFLTILTLGIALVGTVMTLKSETNALPIHISMAVFLALVGLEGYNTWFPSLFPAGKNRRAAESVNLLAAMESERESKGTRPESSYIVARSCTPYWREEFLAPLNFEIAPGEVLVITGASGSGKSTLASALLGFARYSGSLTIGGVEVRDIQELSESITGTLQQGYVFNTSLRENLKIADMDATEGRLREVLQVVELSHIPLDEVLGEFGRTLSGGEAKRLSIARALISPAPIMILDEPLEHLDHERAIRIQSAIMREIGEKTLIVITHSPWLQYSRKLELARE